MSSAVKAKTMTSKNNGGNSSQDGDQSSGPYYHGWSSGPYHHGLSSGPYHHGWSSGPYQNGGQVDGRVLTHVDGRVLTHIDGRVFTHSDGRVFPNVLMFNSRY